MSEGDPTNRTPEEVSTAGDGGACDLCGEPFADGETVVQVVEDRHPTYDKEVVLHTCHVRCCRNREEVRQDCPHCGCMFHLALLRKGQDYQNLSHQLFCPFCATLFDCDMGFSPLAQSPEGVLRPPLPDPPKSPNGTDGCPCCGREIESSPDQEGSCDFYCTRCSWHQHMPGEEELAELGVRQPVAAPVPKWSPAGINVDLELLKRQAAILGRAVEGKGLVEEDLQCLEGLWEFAHSVIDSLEAGPRPDGVPSDHATPLRPTIVVWVEGGVVQGVEADGPARVLVCDFDCVEEHAPRVGDRPCAVLPWDPPEKPSKEFAEILRLEATQDSNGPQDA